LELDGYCEELKTCFEYNGLQHYNKVDYWHKTNKGFEKQQERDRIKKELCEENQVHLIIIPYTIKYYDLYNYILERCTNIPENTPKKIDYSELNLLCFNKSRLKEIDDYVKDNWGGKLISNNYVNNTTHLDFICKEGHKLNLTWGVIIHGTFCKYCNIKKSQTPTLQKIHIFEKTRNITLIDDYINARTKHQWLCNNCSNIVICLWDGIRKKQKVCCN